MRKLKLKELQAEQNERLREDREAVGSERDKSDARAISSSRKDVTLDICVPSPDAPKLQEVPLPPPLQMEIDIVDLLLEERQGSR